MSERWLWSTDEIYRGEAYPTRTDALEAAMAELDPGERFTTGRAVDVPVSALVGDGEHLADMAIDSLADAAREEAGEAADDWPSPTDADRETLAETLAAAVVRWAEEAKMVPDWLKVVDVMEHQTPGGAS